MQNTSLAQFGQVEPDSAIFTSDPDTLLDFLEALDRHGLHQLAAIHPDEANNIVCLTGRLATDRERFGDFVTRFNKSHNIYYSLNEVREGLGNRRASKKDIVSIRAIGLDFDPDPNISEPAAAKKAVIDGKVTPLTTDPEYFPSVVVDSGGGANVIWLLEEKLSAAEFEAAAEAQGNGMAQALGADATFDSTRLLRAPGTINWPNAKKRALGRVAALSRVISDFDTAGATTLDELAKFHPPVAPSQNGSRQFDKTVDIDMDAVDAVTDIADLPKDVRARFENLKGSDKALARLWEGDRTAVSGKDDSGSGFAWALARVLRRSGLFSPTEFGMLIKVCEHTSEPEKIDHRYIARAWSKAPPPPGDELDPVPSDGGKAIPKRGKLWVEWWRDTKPNFDRPYLIDNLLGLGTMVVTYGDSNVGKSYIVLDQARCIAAGVDWNGHKVKQGLVVYVASEGGEGFHLRIEAYRKEFNLADLPFALVPCPVDLHAAGDTSALVQLIKEAEIISGQTCVMVVIDTLARAMGGGDENTSVDMGKLVGHCDRIRPATGATVNLIHHTGKDKAKGARGSSALRAATDTEIEVDSGVVSVQKQRDMAKAEPMHFSLRTVVIGQRADGRDVTACVVDWVVAPEFEAKLTPVHQWALDALTTVMANKVDLGLPAIATFKEWAQELKLLRGGKGRSTKAAGQALDRSLKELIESGLVAKTLSGQYVLPAGAQ